MNGYYLRELYDIVGDGNFVWATIKNRCRHGIRFFSSREYIEKVSMSSSGVYVWRIKREHIAKLV